MHKTPQSCIVLKIAQLRVCTFRSPQAIVAPGVTATHVRDQTLQMSARRSAWPTSKNDAMAKAKIDYAMTIHYAIRKDHYA
jgi:hypothetical protein